MGKSKRKQRRRRGGRSSKARKGGVLLGMRSGFKNVAGAVTGTGEDKKSGKSSWFGTAVLLLLVVAAAAFLFSRYR